MEEGFEKGFCVREGGAWVARGHRSVCPAPKVNGVKFSEWRLVSVGFWLPKVEGGRSGFPQWDSPETRMNRAFAKMGYVENLFIRDVT